MSASSSHRTKEWIKVTGVAAISVALYVGALAFTVEHSKIGNLMLGVLALLGIGISFYLAMTLHDIFGPTSWEVVWRAWRWTSGILALSIVGHVIGAFFAKALDAQMWYAYSPWVILFVALMIRLLKYLIESKKVYESER